MLDSSRGRPRAGAKVVAAGAGYAYNMPTVPRPGHPHHQI